MAGCAGINGFKQTQNSIAGTVVYDEIGISNPGINFYAGKMSVGVVGYALENTSMSVNYGSGKVDLNQQAHWTKHDPASLDMRVSGMGISENTKMQIGINSRMEFDINKFLSVAQGGETLTIECDRCNYKNDLSQSKNIILYHAPIQNKIVVTLSKADVDLYKKERAAMIKRNAEETKQREITASKEKARIARDGDGSPDDIKCQKFGFKPGTTGYADCLLKLNLADRDLQQRNAEASQRRQQAEQAQWQAQQNQAILIRQQQAIIGAQEDAANQRRIQQGLDMLNPPKGIQCSQNPGGFYCQ